MRRWLDRALVGAASGCVLLACGILALLIVSIASRGIGTVDVPFLTTDIRSGGTAGGIVYNIVGTLILIATAGLVCTPFALGTALTAGFYLRSSRARRRLELALYALNGVPSIVIGIVGMIVFADLFGWGKSWLAGGILLALVMLPTVAVAIIERIEALPRTEIEAAFGLGLSESQVVRDVVLPRSRGALLTGLVLGLARAAGETAPILFTATVFVGAAVPTGVRESPVLSLPYHIFVLAQDSLDPAAGERVWGTATVLLVLVIGLSAAALPLRLRIHDEARHG